jgi:hypothetical protein
MSGGIIRGKLNRVLEVFGGVFPVLFVVFAEMIAPEQVSFVALRIDAAGRG